jgi:phosphohistidine phosphatase SixA
VPLLLLRHASAGDRESWVGDDRERPLDDRGRRQADALVELLAAYSIEAIYTSPYRRCVETVGPLARTRGLEPEQREELGEQLQMTAGAELVRGLRDRDVVVCGHGGLDIAALEDGPKWKKGAVFVVSPELRVLDVLRP